MAAIPVFAASPAHSRSDSSSRSRRLRSPSSGQSDRERGPGGPAAQQLGRIEGRCTSPTSSPARSSSRPAAIGAVPSGHAAVDRRHRHPRHARPASGFLPGAWNGADRGRPLRPHPGALLLVRALVHWMTATCFIILALSGLNITFGKQLLLPLIGPEAFTAWSQWAKYAHNYLSFPFTLGGADLPDVAGLELPDQDRCRWLRRAAAWSATSIRRPIASMPARS